MKNSYTLALAVVLSTTSTSSVDAFSASSATRTRKTAVHLGSGAEKTCLHASLQAERTTAIEKQGKTPSDGVKASLTSIVSLDDVVEAIRADETEAGSKERNVAAEDAYTESAVSRRPISELKLGSFIDGFVAHFAPFGVFVKTDYAMRGGYALLHKSQIPARNWRSSFRRGESVRARVVSINYETAQVGLSLVDDESPKELMEYADVSIGQEVPKAIVQHITDYGIFVDVQCRGVNALIHKTRIPTWGRRDEQSQVRVGQEVSVRIIGKNENRSTLEASMLTPEQDDYMNRHWAAVKAVRERHARFEEYQGVEEEDLPDNEESIDLFTEAIEELKTVLMLN